MAAASAATGHPSDFIPRGYLQLIVIIIYSYVGHSTGTGPFHPCIDQLPPLSDRNTQPFAGPSDPKHLRESHMGSSADQLGQIGAIAGLVSAVVGLVGAGAGVVALSA